jgi:site-specific DNA-cytosine methylase
MNYLDLFAGIGGFAFGAHFAKMKFENHLCSEIDYYCQNCASG